MRRAVKFKNIIAFAVVLVVLISIFVTPAYAEFPPLTTAGRRLGSWILATLTAANITLTSTAAASQGADLINFLADPLDVTYSYTEMWDDKPTIQIWDDYVTIDGVTYSDVWLSNEAASKFKTDGMDFATAYSIASNTNGTFAEGEGTSAGLPMFDVNGVTRSQNFTFEYPTSVTTNQYNAGEWGVAITHSNSAPVQRASAYPTSMPSSGSITIYQPFDDDTYTGYVRKRPGTIYCDFVLQGKNYNDTINPGNNNFRSIFTSAPFDFDYVAGTIDATPLEPDEGLMLRIPNSQVPDLQTFINDNPEFAQPGGTTIDVDLDPDIMNKLDDLINIIAPIIPVINNIGNVQFTVNHDTPIPPIPDTPIVDATVPQVVDPIINEITNYGDQITQQIPNIIETIPTIDDICNNIDTAPYHDLDTGLDHLPSFFLPFITDLRSALGIWHYVTEWLGMIGTSFAFVTGCLTGTAIMTPIYAAIAGYMCIKVYRRMTG